MIPRWTAETTEAYVRELFAGMLDKGGQPYAEHCVRVMRALPAEATDDERMAALLHDVIEDTGETGESLRAAGFSERVVWLVERLSRPASGTYKFYIFLVLAARDVGLIRIKLADLADNLDPERVALLPADSRGLIKRYEHAREVLTAALSRLNRPAPGGRS